MTHSTLDYYERNAANLTERYETADVAQIHARLRRAFAPGARLLELGSGSGRDAAAMLASGYQVTITDGSEAMLQQAARGHPELAGRAILHRCPDPLPYDEGSFDGVYALAMLMHLVPAQIEATMAEVARILRPGGRFFFSVPFRRDDIVADDRDANGRLFTNLPPDEWNAMGARCGLAQQESFESPDGLGREGMRWVSVVLEKAE